MSRALYLIIFLIVLIFGFIPQSHAANFTVNDAASLIAAINAANVNNEDDFIRLSANINLTSPYVWVIGLPLILSDGGHTLTIDGNGFEISRNLAASEFRFFEIDAGASLNLNNITLRNGYISPFYSDGGAIRNEGTLNIFNSSFVDNQARVGGAIFNLGTVNIVNSSFRNNNALEAGGGIANGGSVNITNSQFIENTADVGAGIFNDTILIVNNSSFEGNVADYSGGGIETGLTAEINNSTFRNNSARFGAGILTGYYFSSTITITTINNSTFSGNSAEYGAGIFAEGVTRINNSTFANNSAIDGTALIQDGGDLGINNTIMADGVLGNDCMFAGVFSGSNNLIESGNCPAMLTTDPNLAPLADNGGPTLTHAILSPSPAIDASGTGALNTDQRGMARIGIRDIGAFEFGTITYPSVQFAVPELGYSEDAGTVSIALEITAGENFAGIIEVFIADSLSGTATEGLDYGNFGLQSVLIDCSTGVCPSTVNLSLNLLADLLAEADETVLLEIVGTNGFATVGAIDSFTARIQELSVSISANDANASENPSETGQFTVSLGELNNTGSPISVSYAINGTANNGIDYSLISGTLDIPTGQQTATIDIVPIDDIELEGDESVILSLTSTNNSNVAIDTSPATVIIADDDLPPISPTATAILTTQEVASVNEPEIGVFDPAISKLGILQVGQTGIVGEQLEWIVTVSNTGNAIGQNVNVRDTLIAALRIDRVNAPNATVAINGQTVTVTYPVLNIGQTVQFSIFTTVLQGLSIENTACVIAANQAVEECVLALPISQLPSTGENPLWRNLIIWVGGFLFIVSVILVFWASRSKQKV